MAQKRHLSASLLDPNGNMWVLGGTSSSSTFDATEIYQYKTKSRGFGRWRKGFPLPPALRDTGIEGHCAVSINSTHKFLVGGYARPYDFTVTVKNYVRGTALSKAWMYDGQSWNDLMPMSIARDRPACTLVQTNDGAVSYIILDLITISIQNWIQ